MYTPIVKPKLNTLIVDTPNCQKRYLVLLKIRECVGPGNMLITLKLGILISTTDPLGDGTVDSL